MFGARVATTIRRKVMRGDAGLKYEESKVFERTPVSRAELEARKAFKPTQPETMEYARIQKAFHESSSNRSDWP
jgi:hypothetical protein